jgi:DNA-binding MarR family transcriptional regulator
VRALWDDKRITAFGMLLEAHAALLGNVGRDLQAASDIPLTWFEVLIRLARTPGYRLRMTELASQAALSASNLTRVVDRMEDAGLIRRDACTSDRRGAFAVLTDTGIKTLETALPVHLETLQRNVAGPLGSRRLDTLTSMLEVLRDIARGGPPRPPE